MIGNKYILLPTVDSTNNYAAKLLNTGKIAHGTVILADEQTAGKGQRGNKWQSTARKQFICSVYLETAFLSVERYWYLNLAVAIAVRTTIADYISEQVTIKWPNDVFIANRKVAGILIETQWSGGKLRGAVAGVGINIHPEPEMPTACALADFTATVPEPLELGQRFAAHLQTTFEQLRRSEWTALMQQYLNALWMLDRETPVVIAGTATSGCIRGLDENGNLLFETGGELRAFGLKEIAFLQ